MHEMHTMKLRFHEQTEIRYNHVLHDIRATSKPNSKTREISREASLLQMERGKHNCCFVNENNVVPTNV